MHNMTSVSCEVSSHQITINSHHKRALCKIIFAFMCNSPAEFDVAPLEVRKHLERFLHLLHLLVRW